MTYKAVNGNQNLNVHSPFTTSSEKRGEAEAWNPRREKRNKSYFSFPQLLSYKYVVANDVGKDFAAITHEFCAIKRGRVVYLLVNYH